MNKTNEKNLTDEKKSAKTKKTTTKKTSSTKAKKTSENTAKKTATAKKTTTKAGTKKASTKSTTKPTTVAKKKTTPTKSSTSSKNIAVKPKSSTVSKRKATDSIPVQKGKTKSEVSYLKQENSNLKIQGMDISALENRLKTLKKNSSNLINEGSNINSIISPNKPNTIVQKKSNIENNKKTKKKNKKLNVFYNLIITVCIVLIIYSIYNIILWQKNNKDNDKLIEQVTEIAPVEKTEIVKIDENIEIEKKKFDFTELLRQNSDTVGWITVPNTEINYPVVKGPDNDYYLKRAFDQTYNAAGWIYADYRNNCDGTDKNLIIYGHNRLNNNMFGTLENTLTDEWLSDKSNYYINYSSLNNSYLFEIFSVFICGGDESVEYMQTDFDSPEDYMVYLGTLRDLSYHNFNTNLTNTDKIITLYTCHGLNNQRLIVCGKLIEISYNTTENSQVNTEDNQ